MANNGASPDELAVRHLAHRIALDAVELKHQTPVFCVAWGDDGSGTAAAFLDCESAAYCWSGAAGQFKHVAVVIATNIPGSTDVESVLLPIVE